jgi:hypothetical protein
MSGIPAREQKAEMFMLLANSADIPEFSRTVWMIVFVHPLHVSLLISGKEMVPYRGCSFQR